MTGREGVLAALAAIGSPCTLSTPQGERVFYACIQPRGYATQARTREERTPFGWADPREYTYFGPVEGGGELVERGSLLENAQGRFQLRLVQDFYWQGQPVLRQGVAVRWEEEA